MPLGRHLRTGYLKRGGSLAELARGIGVDATTLEATVQRFNEHARRGEDPDFGKGSKAYNRYQGDALNQPNPCVAPLETGPFYAIKLVVGDIGTFAGLATDAQTRVLDVQARPIPGLYAVGNDAASIMGGNYPGAGITLGPALTFGYVAGLALAAAPELSATAAGGGARRAAACRGLTRCNSPVHAGLLPGRRALVTGAGQGNGRAIAIGLAQAGASVVCCDINAATVAETASLIEAAGGRARAQVLDVTDAAACQALATQLAADGEAVDLLVNNAGILIREGSDSPNAAANFERVMRVNVQGTFNVTQAFLAQLKAARGHIVNIASIAAFAGQGSIGPTRRPRARSRCTRSRWRRNWRPSACASTRWRRV
jgi:hypothetical protein